MSPGTRLRTSWFALLLVLGLMLNPGYVDNVDSRIVRRAAQELLDHGRFGIPPDDGVHLGGAGEYGATGADGLFQMKFGPGNAILAAPAVAAGRALFTPLGLPRDAAGDAGYALSAALWFALSGLAVLVFAQRVASPRIALLAAAIHCLASFALVYGRSAYLETPLAVFVVLAFTAALDVRERATPAAALALGAACAAAVWIKLASVVMLAGVAPVVLWRRPPREVLRAVGWAALPFGAAMLALAASNASRFGHWASTGYAGSARFDTPVVEGAVALLFSRRGGLLFYAPALLAAVPGLFALRDRCGPLAAGLVAASLAALGVHGAFFSPFGGDAWGPRYLVPSAALLAVPAALGLAGWSRRGAVLRAVAAAVVAAGVVLQAPAAVVSFTEVYALRGTPAETALVAPQPVLARILVEKLRGAGNYDLKRIAGVPGTVVPEGVHRGLSLWPVRVAERIPARSGLAVVTWFAAAAAGVACGVWMASALRSPAT